jgi:deazaflavin-dependent oxidoreductase (nitroreductase family)
MPLPEGLARFNRKFSNRLLRPLARVMPGFGVLRHRGRNTGARYETPLNVFKGDGRFIVALTYGGDVDWLKNARSSGDTEIVTRGRVIAVGRPNDLASEEGMAAMPAPVRFILDALEVTGFVEFPVAD